MESDLDSFLMRMKKLQDLGMIPKPQSIQSAAERAAEIAQVVDAVLAKRGVGQAQVGVGASQVSSVASNTPTVGLAGALTDLKKSVEAAGELKSLGKKLTSLFEPEPEDDDSDDGPEEEEDEEPFRTKEIGGGLVQAIPLKRKLDEDGKPIERKPWSTGETVWNNLVANKDAIFTGVNKAAEKISEAMKNREAATRIGAAGTAANQIGVGSVGTQASGAQASESDPFADPGDGGWPE
jgi:hypothetical protein